MHSFSFETLAQDLVSDSAERCKKARKKCREILDNQPNNADFLYFMGIIDSQLGHVDQALKWIKRGLVLTPDSAEINCLYAKLLAAQKKYDEAISIFKHSIALKQDYATAYYGLGTVYKECGNEANAIQAYNDALVIDPDFPEVLNDLGVILKNKGMLIEATTCFTRAISVKPEYPLPFNNLGLIHFTLGNSDEAENLYRRALAIKPDYPEALNNLGIILQDHGEFAESMFLYKKALAIKPDYPDALNNISTILQLQGEFEESIDFCKKVLSIQPSHSEALNNLGNALKSTGNLTESISAYKQAIALKSDYPEYHMNLSMALLAAGQFDEGWRMYEWRWKTAQFAHVKQDISKPLWNGEAVAGSILLMRAEQGFGDTLQFCRYVTLAAARGLHVILEVQPALVTIMKSVPGIMQVIAQGQPLPNFDYYCPMMSLPLAFNTQQKTIPQNVPYLSINKESIDIWRNRLSNDNSEKLKVGLVWSGSARLQSQDLIAADRRRSITTDLLAPLMDISGIQFYSLQKTGLPAPKKFNIIDCMDECRDFADTAAYISNLDLVISVDTAVAHLAGALGKPVWILNRFDSCWRWIRDRDDSPWYPTLRLFHQSSPGDWTNVVARIGNELQKLVANR